MTKKSGQVAETSKERALAEVGTAQMADFKARWLPVQQRFAAGVVKANEPGSFERGRATTMAGVDNSQRFGVAQEKLDAGAAARGGFGSAGHKLGITGMAEDRATAGGLAVVGADQGSADRYVSGLSAITALGRGEKAMAVQGMGTSARISAAQASADADRSLQERAGLYQFGATVAGAGLAAWNQKPPPRDPWAINGPGE